MSTPAIRSSTALVVLAALLLSSRAVAQSTARQSAIPLRDLKTLATSANDTIGFMGGMRELSDGRVFVNDVRNRRLLLFDAALSHAQTVTTDGVNSAFPYGPRGSAIIPFTGDSTLFVDVPGRALLVVTPEGRVARVMSAPRPFDIPQLPNGGFGAPRFDPSGRLIYRTMLAPNFKPPEVGKRYETPTMPDSAPLLRVDFDTRRADTVAWLRTAKMKVATTALPNGGVRLSLIYNPLIVVDDWAALADGSIAILRGQDYRVDWIGADGKMRNGPRLPFAWKRLTDEEKITIIDSTRRAMEAAQRNTLSAGGVASTGIPGAGAPDPNHSMTMMPVAATDGAPTPRAESAAGMTITAAPPAVQVVDPADLPDYYPAVSRAGLMKADRAGNVWVLPATSTFGASGLVYDVVNRDGKVVERVRLPRNRLLEGFGRDGAVYLSAHETDGVRIERARVERAGVQGGS